MTELEFYKEAKKYFSKKENQILSVEKTVKRWPSGICSLLSKKYCARAISEYNKRVIDMSIRNAVKVSVYKLEKKNPDYRRDYYPAYFPTHKERMSFINKQIEDLTKK